MRYKANGVWKPLSWNDWNQASIEIAAGLAALGVQKGDRVCLLANTRPEWFMCDIGILMAGAVTVPIYQSNTPEQCQYIVDDSGARVVIAENAGQAAKVKSVKIVAMDAADGAVTLAKLREAGRKWLGEDASETERTRDAVGRTQEAGEPRQMFTIVSTSGTTGPPKGVVLVHSNMVFETEVLTAALRLGDKDEQLLFLPLAHIFAKIMMWSSIEGGALTSFAR